MNMVKKMVAVAIAAGSANAYALNIDFGGNGNIAGSYYTDQLAMLTSSAILTGVQDPAGLALANAGFFYAQAQYILPGSASPSVMTWQLAVPVLTTTLPGSTPGFASLYDVSLTGPGVFKMFISELGNAGTSVLSGDGFGDVNGGSLVGDQVEIAAGTVTLSSTFVLSLLEFLGTGPLDSCGVGDPCNPFFGGATSESLNGSANFNVDITSRNTSYIVSELDALSLDMNLQNLSFTAPFVPPNVASTEVVNYTAFLGDDSWQNDTCVSAGGTFCDFEMQIGGNSLFFDAPVPEPTSLALAGLGLSAFGLIRRRRARMA